MSEVLLEKLIAFGNEDKNVRAIILEGSRATGFHVDDLSDYDINIFARDIDGYINGEAWIKRLGDVLILQKEKFVFYGATIPTRLVLFRDYQRVDFSFWKTELLADIARGDKVYESYKNGYQVLVDKDEVAELLPPPDNTGFSISPPDREHFRQIVHDFWFEAYGMAKYLSKGDLWYSKLIENRFMKDRLFLMALWDNCSSSHWKYNSSIHRGGKRFEKWAPKELKDSFSECFSMYEISDTWRSLFIMVETFNKLARNTASRMGFDYSDKLEEDILVLLELLRGRNCSH